MSAIMPARGKGRPRSFDRDKALQKALEVFWTRGYGPATVAELCAAIGINPPSLYAAFGNKDALFLEALQHYETTYWAAPWQALADEADLRRGMERFLYEAAAILSSRDVPCGCLVVQNSGSVSPDSDEVRDALRLLREASKAASTNGSTAPAPRATCRPTRISRPWRPPSPPSSRACRPRRGTAPRARIWSASPGRPWRCCLYPLSRSAPEIAGGTLPPALADGRETRYPDTLGRNRRHAEQVVHPWRGAGFRVREALAALGRSGAPRSGDILPLHRWPDRALGAARPGSRRGGQFQCRPRPDRPRGITSGSGPVRCARCRHARGRPG